MRVSRDGPTNSELTPTPRATLARALGMPTAAAFEVGDVVAVRIALDAFWSLLDAAADGPRPTPRCASATDEEKEGELVRAPDGRG